jgi:competence ComEA-like helix-hairpin-helix protein
MWKDFFYFSKREKQGIIVLISLIAGIFIGKFLFTPKENSDVSAQNEQIAEATDSVAPSFEPYKRPSTNFSKKKQPEKRTYYQNETSLNTSEKSVDRTEYADKKPAAQEFEKQEKFSDGTVIELNVSDTSDLKKIPGIGSSFAKRIVGYRQLLGGYYRLEQLQEVYGMYVELFEKITPFLRVDEAQVIKLKVNTASLDKLKAHPYMNFYRAKAIVDMRKKKGKLSDISELSLLEEFPEDVLERLNFYFDFE